MTVENNETKSSSDHLKQLLFFSNKKFSSTDLQELESLGFFAAFSEGVAQLNIELATIRPYAFVLDVEFCSLKSISLQSFLRRLKSNLNGIPVFLMNASNVSYYELITSQMIYAVLKEDSSIGTLGLALKRYQQCFKKYRHATLMRFGVSVPCLVKKLGSSGLIQGQICDLSPKGMKIELDLHPSDWSTGDEIRFSFKGAGQRESNHLDGSGLFRWSQLEEPLPGVQKVRVGIEFNQLPEPTLHGVLDIINSARAAPD